MKTKIQSALLLSALFATSSCSKDDDLPLNDNTSESVSKYIVAATSSEATYLLSLNDLSTGESSIVNNGVETDNASAWIFWNEKFAYRMVYNQGNAGVTTSYVLNEKGTITERNIRHEIQSRFTTYGTFQNYVITAASGATDNKDAAGNPQYGITFTKIDVENQTMTTQTVPGENLLGTGEYCTVSGIVEANGKIYTAVCPEGVSQYGALNNAHLLSPQAKALINSEGGISGTITPNQVWVAIHNNSDFSSPKIITDNRISYATSRYRSQYYSTLAADDSGDVYVFSSSHATSLTGIQKTNLPSGVVRIRSNSEEFDPSYYVNFEDDGVAGRAIYKVWHIKEDYFLMQMYAEKGDDKSYKVNTNRLAIFKAGDKQFKWVSGMPDPTTVGSFSKNAYSNSGIGYIAVTPVTAGAKPTIYVIDPETATAKAGSIITAEGVTAIGKLSNK